MTIRATFLAAGALLAATCSDLRAQGVEVSPFVGYRFGGEFENAATGDRYTIQAAPTFGVMIDVPIGSNPIRTELLWCRQDTEIQFPGTDGPGLVDLTVDLWELGAIAEETKDDFVEYISAHVGLTHISTSGHGSDTRVNLSAAVGAKFFIKPNVALKAEVRGICTFVDTEATIISIGEGSTLLHYSGSTLWQGQATLGLSVIF
ncbi:MAG: outer membrane beta-barrel protein [Opitutaceae bacterium]|nr:outer membrane beta-barrel protein [Opitutaceae bacterium]